MSLFSATNKKGHDLRDFSIGDCVGTTVKIKNDED